MTTEVIVSLIGLIGIFIKVYFEFKKTNQLINYRLDAIEKKINLHNGYAEKFASTAKDISAIQKDVEWLKRRSDAKN